MSHPNDDDSKKANDTAAKIREIIAGVQMRRLDVSDESIIANHPELTPELGRKLNQLRRINVARQKAAASDGDSSISGRTDRNLTTVAGAGMRIHCPHCHNNVEIIVDAPLTDIVCDSCGSHFSLTGDEHDTGHSPAVKELAHFEFLERIGIGAFGTVWKARDTNLDRTVAVKIPRHGQLSGEDVEKFFREARATAQLCHPNIVTVHEIGRSDDTIYIVSDLIRGVSLSEWRKAYSPSAREAAQQCCKISEALHHAHRQGVVHRDLKPQNIMIDATGEPHIMDFGLAKRDAGEITMTIDGQILGTPAYMSPEQARGHAHDVDARADVYSIGVILFELLTGELPFRGNQRMLLHQVINDDPPSPRKLDGNVSRDLETICMKCLRKEPRRRYTDAAQLAADLYRWIGGKPILARPVSRIERAWMWSKRNPVIVATVATALVIVSVVLFVARYKINTAQTERMAEFYHSSEDPESRAFVIADLLNYLSGNAEALFDLLVDANPPEFAPIFEKLAAHRKRAIELGRAELAKLPLSNADEDAKQALAMRQANSAVMLLRMNAADQVWPLLKQSTDPRLRSYITHWLGPRGADAKTIIARYKNESDVSIKRALLLCLGEYDDVKTAVDDAFIKELLDVYRSHPDAGLHGAAEWLLRQLEEEEALSEVDKELRQTEEQLLTGENKNKRWYLNSQGQTFVILDAEKEFLMGSPVPETSRNPYFPHLHRRKVGRWFAISTKEVTKAQWREFSKSNKVISADEGRLQDYLPTDDSPMVELTWHEAALYCNWLSEQERIPEEQWCYERDGNHEGGARMKAKENFLELNGYRLPTEAEWEFACRADAETNRYYGTTDALLPEYAWCLWSLEDRHIHAYPVARLKPNDFGIFDMLGNVTEWCYDVAADYPPAETVAADNPGADAVVPSDRRIVRGGSFHTPSWYVESAIRITHWPNERNHTIGFRPARTYPR